MKDDVWNETSNRVSGPDGPLRLQVPDKWFSPNGDGRKDRISFNVISESAAPYSVEVRKAGAVMASWRNLVGNQPLTWDGKANGATLPEGQYNIVVFTEDKKERIRDNEKVGIDLTPPVFSNSRLQKKAGQYELRSAFKDQYSGVVPESLQITFEDANGQAVNIPGQLASEVGKSPFIYSLQASAHQIEQLKSGELKARAKFLDNAENWGEKVLSLEEEITLQSARFLDGGDIELKGTVKADMVNMDFSKLRPDFFDYIDFTDYQVTQDSGNQRKFTIIVPFGFKFNANYEAMINSLPDEEVYAFKMDTRVALAQSNQEALVSNTVKIQNSPESDEKRWEGEAQVLSGLEVDEQNASDSEGQDFQIQSLFGIPNEAYAKYGKPTFSVGTGKAGVMLVGFNQVFNQAYSTILKAQQRVLVEAPDGRIVFDRYIKYPSNYIKISQIPYVKPGSLKRQIQTTVQIQYSWNGQMNNGQYIPTAQTQTGKPYVIRFVEGILKTDTFTHNQNGNFVDKIDVINCHGENITRYPEKKLTDTVFRNNNRNKHGVGWPDSEILAFINSDPEKKPVGRFGGPHDITGGLTDINRVLQLAKQVCPGARQWFRFPTPNHSQVFLSPSILSNPNSWILNNPTHVYIQVKTAPSLGEVHAYPAFLAEIYQLR